LGGLLFGGELEGLEGELGELGELGLEGEFPPPLFGLLSVSFGLLLLGGGVGVEVSSSLFFEEKTEVGLGGRLSFLFSFLTCSFSFSETSFFFLLYF
jgi:hypothetical protein